MNRDGARKQQLEAMTMRVATYIRTGTQPNDAFSVAHQRCLLQEHVRKQGWRLVEEFADCGAAGPQRGAGLQRLLRDASAARFDAVLVTHPDRLGKRIDTLNEAIEALSATGITVRSLTSPLPLTSPCRDIHAEDGGCAGCG